MSRPLPRTTLEQWQTLQAIADCGSYAQAAEALSRSQSAVSYAVARLQSQLGVRILEQDGRRMRLTPLGRMLLDESRPLLEGALQLEQRAHTLTPGWEDEVALAVEALLPPSLLVQALQRFAQHCAGTGVQVHQCVMSGGEELLQEGRVDVAVLSHVPRGFLGDWLLDEDMLAVAAPGHPLLGRPHPPDSQALRHTPQVVVRDSGQRHPRDEGWLSAHPRLTVGTLELARELVLGGLAFAWLPRRLIEQDLEGGRLLPLPLPSGQRRTLPLHLVLAHGERSGPAARMLADCLRLTVRQAQGG